MIRPDLLKGKQLKKPTKATVVPCVYNADGVDCIHWYAGSDECKTCGWNPEVAAKRKVEPPKKVSCGSMIFTKRWK